ncbi:transporter substrate-binding domain-containing protein [Leisingera sp. SS27]|uniref:substrate-binding periplasmic protein n=1 Tax=Leisingera sp. SS27 TaxID=2979462 RepID=UPI00232AA560|nr:transporter substrate-binding domain-containing protein [Leisingera sp. SS27]MDC0658198.1 transporter substrate-binding domain-containing protein [Leisingera sp. SS27]
MSKIAPFLISFLFAAHAAQAEELHFCYDPYPPYTLGTYGPASSGLKVALLEAVTARIENLTATVTLLPWKRCQQQARDGTIDGVLPLFPNPERAEYMAFTDATFDEQSVLWHRPDQFPGGFVWDGSFGSISHLRLGMLTGSYVDEGMETAFESQQGITRARDIQTLMELLVLGRVDLVATDAAVGRHILEKAGWQDKAQRMATPVASRTSHFGLSKASGASRHLEDFNRAIAALHAEGAIAAILSGE